MCFGSLWWSCSDAVAKLLQTGSHLVSQYFGLFTDIPGVIYKRSLPNASFTQAAPCHHTATSMTHYLDPACISVQVHSTIDNQIYLDVIWCHPKDVIRVFTRLVLSVLCFVPISNDVFCWTASIEANVMHCTSHYLGCYKNFHQSLYLQVDCASSGLSMVSFKEDDRCDFDLYYYNSFSQMCRCTQYQMYLFLW